MNGRVLRLGTRGSALALAQAHLVADALAEHGIDHEIVVIETAGDTRAPNTAWGEGAFVTAIESALNAGQIDIAVHSAKDLPTDEDARLTIAAFLPRAEPRDALVMPRGLSASVDSLTAGTVVGTDSPRRTGFLRAHRADLDVQPMHGNVDTRLRKLDGGAAGALILAAAGLIRLGHDDRITQLIPDDVIPPAPGQGAIAVQVRTGDQEALEVLSDIDDGSTRIAVEAEREFLRATGGGCRAPVGALATVMGERLELTGAFATIDGQTVMHESISGFAVDRIALAKELAARLVRRRSAIPGAPRVLITRPAEDSAKLIGRLAEQGIGTVVVPAIEVELIDDNVQLDRELDNLADYRWAVATSANGIRAVTRAAGRRNVDLMAVKWAAVGSSTARELARAGVRDIWVPDQANAAALAAQLPIDRDDHVLWLHGDLADPAFSDELGQRGAIVTSVAEYRTVIGPSSSRELLEAALAAGPIDAVILASPSAVHGLREIADASYECDLRCVPAVCIGERTAGAARETWCDAVVVAASPDASDVAELTAQMVHHKNEAREKAEVTA